MSEKNPNRYNPEGLSDEEMAKIDKEEAEKRRDLLSERLDARAKTPNLGNVVLEKTLHGPKWGLPSRKFKKGIHVRDSAGGLLRTREEISDKSEVKETKTESPGKKLFKEIKSLLKKYEFGGEFKLTTSKTAKGNYMVKLFPASDRALVDPELEFEERAEKAVARLKEYMDHTYKLKIGGQRGI